MTDKDDISTPTYWKIYRKRAKRGLIALPIFIVIMFIGLIASEVLNAKWPFFVAFALGAMAGATIVGTHGGEVFHDD